MGLKIGLLVAVAIATVAATAASATPVSDSDPFYVYTGSTPLASIPPGTVLNTRTMTYNLSGFPTPLTALQLLYRTNNAQKQAVVNVTTVLMNPNGGNGEAISYQSAYDSLNPYDEPSAVITGDKDITKVFNDGTIIASAESVPLAALVVAGYTVIIPDTEGQTADFAVGPEEGMTTLDSIRAALNTPSTGLAPSSKVAMIGYSGGAIGTDWAAQLAPTYAPDVNRQLVGAAFGGLLIDPIHNVTYVNQSIVWGGVAAAALVGFARAYGIDPTPYLNSSGVAVLNDIQNQGLGYILPKYLGLNWETLVQPQYVSAYNTYLNGGGLGGFALLATVANAANAGLIGSPTIPIYFTQGDQGYLDGTFYPEPGDGVMLADDARTLSQQFCASGTSVQYNEIPLEHATAAAAWVVGMLPWVYGRFAGAAAPSNCAAINLMKGRSLAAVPLD